MQVATPAGARAVRRLVLGGPHWPASPPPTCAPAAAAPRCLQQGQGQGREHRRHCVHRSTQRPNALPSAAAPGPPAALSCHPPATSPPWTRGRSAPCRGFGAPLNPLVKVRMLTFLSYLYKWPLNEKLFGLCWGPATWSQKRNESYD